MTPKNLPATLASAAAALTALVVLALAPAGAHAGDPHERRAETRERRDVRIVVPDEGRSIILGNGRRGFLGVHVVDLTTELRRHFQAGAEAGVLVSRVEPGSPAAAAGIAVGDVMVAIDGEPVAAARDLRRVVGPRRGGDQVAVDVVRNGRRLQLAARLEEREGRVLDLGNLMQRDSEGRSVLVLSAEQDWADFARQFEHLGEEIGEAVEEALENPEVRMRIGREVRQREHLERQIELLERRLRELERRLEDQRR
jgi:hypothetical protein